MANAGGGVIVVEGTEFDEELLHEQLERYVEPEFEAFEVREIGRPSGPATARRASPRAARTSATSSAVSSTRSASSGCATSGR